MPRVALSGAILPFAHAALDVSDGLAQDLGHILNASGVGAEIWTERLPTLPALKTALTAEQWFACTLAGGDDYELVFTAPASYREAVSAAAERSATPVARIGKINGTGRLKILDSDGREIKLTHLGFDHFG
ncbi:hypothetical protein BG910_08095 [Neisseria chenwenguii]|uniref:Uncharacterized protein n=1 Tax=Neisseria chenwenguii TaxID=1853278 RepID=A0A220S2N6_9NEIS|nr:hypothetical protein BG910_08095 [Neisseria chenwenguii]ROV55679.1 hypothetical protein EGS38_08255 [Neisseria chenwenguii]